jgi:hypothetical protein
MPRALLLTALSAALTLTFACSEEPPEDEDDAGTGAMGGGGDDGKHHPPPNGTRISEEEACNLLRDAYDQKVQDLGCVQTLPVCLAFIRVPYDPDCAEFDQGSVQGCIDFYNDIWRCDLLDFEACVVTVYPENAVCP